MSSTILYGNVVAGNGSGPMHVVGYQNTVQNLHPGPNMMILPVPAQPDTMGPGSFLKTEGTPNILKDMVAALRVMTRDSYGSKGITLGGTPRMQVFSHGIYDIAMGDQVTRAALAEALQRVSPAKRPVLTPAAWDVLMAYPDLYPGDMLVYACFDNADAREATPLLYRYSPRTPDLRLPALDAHTGRPPIPGEMVHVDHTIVLGAADGALVNYQDDIYTRGYHRYLAQKVVGMQISGTRLPNGDFWATADDMRGNTVTVIRDGLPSVPFRAYPELEFYN